MRYLWFIYAIVSLADLILSGIFLNPSMEANPIASWIWSKFGYIGIVFFKIAVVCFLIYPTVKYIEKSNKKISLILMTVAIFLTGITCILFGAMNI